MRRRVIAVFRALFEERTDAPVHFHSGPTGHPAVCHDERCENPRLTVE